MVVVFKIARGKIGGVMAGIDGKCGCIAYLIDNLFSEDLEGLEQGDISFKENG